MECWLFSQEVKGRHSRTPWLRLPIVFAGRDQRTHQYGTYSNTNNNTVSILTVWIIPHELCMIYAVYKKDFNFLHEIGNENLFLMFSLYLLK